MTAVSMTYTGPHPAQTHERAPSARLAGIVHRYTGFDHAGVGARRREVAQDRVTIILLLGPHMSVGGPLLPERQIDSFIAPLCPSFALTADPPRLTGVQIDLTPLGAFQLLGVPMAWMADQLVVPLADVLGAEAELLAERLDGLRTWEQRLAAVDVWIAERVSRSRMPMPDICWAWKLVADSGGTMPIGAVAATVGCSRRHLERRFAEQVGVSPKTAARLVRFQRTVTLLETTREQRFAEVAQSAGFCDQPHLNREFMRLAGVPPREYVGARLPEGLGVAA